MSRETLPLLDPLAISRKCLRDRVKDIPPFICEAYETLLPWQAELPDPAAVDEFHARYNAANKRIRTYRYKRHTKARAYLKVFMLFLQVSLHPVFKSAETEQKYRDACRNIEPGAIDAIQLIYELCRQRTNPANSRMRRYPWDWPRVYPSVREFQLARRVYCLTQCLQDHKELDAYNRWLEFDQVILSLQDFYSITYYKQGCPEERVQCALAWKKYTSQAFLSALEKVAVGMG